MSAVEPQTADDERQVRRGHFEIGPQKPEAARAKKAKCFPSQGEAFGGDVMENRRWHERTLAARSYPVKARGKALVEAANPANSELPSRLGSKSRGE